MVQLPQRDFFRPQASWPMVQAAAAKGAGFTFYSSGEAVAAMVQG